MAGRQTQRDAHDEGNGMTIREVLLTAAGSLGGEKFTAEDLTAEAFLYRPAVMGLAGHPEYPDHRKTINSLYGPHGLVTIGVIQKNADGTFRLEKQDPVTRPHDWPKPAAAAPSPSLPFLDKEDDVFAEDKTNLPTPGERDLYLRRPYEALLRFMKRTGFQAGMAKLAFDIKEIA